MPGKTPLGLDQFFGIRSGSSPPVGDPEEKAGVLAYPIVEALIADLHWLIRFLT